MTSKRSSIPARVEPGDGAVARVVEVTIAVGMPRAFSCATVSSAPGISLDVARHFDLVHDLVHARLEGSKGKPAPNGLE